MMMMMMKNIHLGKNQIKENLKTSCEGC